jgi:hypothetical protein
MTTLEGTTLEIKRFDSKYNNNNEEENGLFEIPIIIMKSNQDQLPSPINDINENGSKNSVNSSNNNEVQYNKYGFLQTQTQSVSLNNTLILNKKKNKKTSNDNLNNSTASSLAISNNNSSIQLNNSNGQNYVNMKEIIQNTPVEYFAEHLPNEVIRSREMKWFEMLNNYDEWMSKRFNKVKQRCRKGIPQSMRYRAWLYLTNANVYKTEMNRKVNGDYYLKCLTSQNVDLKCIEEIKRDLHRQFPCNSFFFFY